MNLYPWEYFNLKTPSPINNIYTFTKELTGDKCECEYSILNDAPMWVNIPFHNNIIYYNNKYMLAKYMVYHEYAHILCNDTIYKKFNPENASKKLIFLILAEYNAIKTALKLAHKHKDTESVIDTILSIFIYMISSKYDERTEHYIARKWLLYDYEFLKIVKQYYDIETLLKYANIWENIIEKSHKQKLKKCINKLSLYDKIVFRLNVFKKYEY